MTHQELIDRFCHLSAATDVGSTEYLRMLGALIADTLAAGQAVTLHGLGTIKVVGRAGRNSRNPMAGEAIQIPAKRVLKISPAKALREWLNPPQA